MSVPEYLPGAWSAVSRPGFVALLGPTAAPATARALWEASTDGLLAGLVVLARNGFGGLPPFALVHVERGRAHLALRGDVTAEVATANGSHTIRAGEVGTWSEQVFDGVVSVRLVTDDAPPAEGALPLGDGVAPASALRVVLVDGQDLVEDAADEVPADLPSPGGPAAEAVPDVPDLVLPPPGAGSVDAPGPRTSLDQLAEADPAPVGDPTSAAEHTPEGDVLPEPVLPAPVLPESVVPEPVLPEPVLPEPVLPESVVPEPVLPEPVLPDPAPADLTAVDPVRVDEREPVPALVALSAPEADVESTVEGVRTLVGPASPDDHDGLTILSSDLAQIREQLPAWASQWQEGQTPGPFAVPAPDAAAHAPRLLLSTGVEVSLDRTVLLGRAPQVARVTNRELPRLVAVPSPQQDISRTHAEVRAEGEHVLVTDLHSTNGVHVSRQGEGARRLHPGEPSVVVEGEVVDLGDGVTFTVTFAPDAGDR